MKDNSVLGNISLRENVFLTRVYSWMVVGLGLTGLMAWLFAQSEYLMRFVVSNPITIIGIVVAEFAVVIILGVRIKKLSTGGAIACFLAYSCLTGITFSSLIVVYAGTDIISKAFFSACGVFVGASLYGTFTKRNLRKWTQMLFAGMVGILVALLINLFLRSSALDLAISIFGVLMFTLITAWDTKKIVSINRAYGDSMTEEELTKISIVGALDLYLDFINIFLYLVKLFAKSRDN
ncbi:MAG: Bax inhibitor-1/YccA family protein [Spirochaetales bacterium]|nr:Bax inhibitor-1/YccA family protein [Spirochaetales bacterium]